jgi:predicted extracellular nuclease
VNFQTHRNRTWAIFGNHWPSRSGGQLECAGYRAIAGETLAYFHQRVGEVHGDDTPVLAMGDFNDEPFDLSLVQYALSTTRQRATVGYQSPAMELDVGVDGPREGTFYFENFSNFLDQFLVNNSMVKATSPIQAVPGSVEIIRFPAHERGGDVCGRHRVRRDGQARERERVL